jgi:hypothetical protein
MGRCGAEARRAHFGTGLDWTHEVMLVRRLRKGSERASRSHLGLRVEIERVAGSGTKGEARRRQNLKSPVPGHDLSTWQGVQCGGRLEAVVLVQQSQWVRD